MLIKLFYKIFKFTEGRQHGGYFKSKLFEHKFYDMYLIHYPAKSFISTHIDPVKNKKHYRLNIIIQGEDNFIGNTIYSSNRIKFFRPDINPHSVKPVNKDRLILSFGYVI